MNPSSPQDMVFGVSDFVALINQTLDFAYPSVSVEGEVSGFKISKNKWVYFDLKDKESTVNCFMTIYQMNAPIEDGMRLRVRANPRLTKWGRFSLTVSNLQPVGEGSLKRAMQLLQVKLEKEGLFDPARKRRLPVYPQRIGVVSSAQAAGYGDFLKIINARWGGLTIVLADVQVQGDAAPAQVVAAIEHFGQMAEPVDVLVVKRGGGSADDLAAFSAESVVRAVAASRVPTVVAVGHEIDVSLADLAADVRASTPSNAAELLVPDRTELLSRAEYMHSSIYQTFRRTLGHEKERLSGFIESWRLRMREPRHRLELLEQQLLSLSPTRALEKGYSIVRSEKGLVRRFGDVSAGERIMIELSDAEVVAEVKDVKKIKR